MISIKKLATVGVAAGLLAASALPVLANGDGIEQENKGTKVKNDITATSNSGGNKIKAYDDVKGAKIKTGDATTIVEVLNKVNSNKLIAPCECVDGEDGIEQENKWTKVKNYVTADSNTGDNKIKSSSDDVKWAKIKTGDAYTGVSISNYVNKNKIVLTGEPPE